MKKLLLIVSIFFPFILFSQETITLKDGAKVILYPDKTWKFESDVIIPAPGSDTDTSKILISMRKYTSVYTSPDLNLAIENFQQHKVEVIDYHSYYFTIKDSLGRIGYLNEFSIDKGNEISKRVINKIVSKAILEKKNLLLRNIEVEEINSADGVDFSIDWIFTNPKKIIKYIYFTVVPYNAVGDIMSCRISGHSSFTGKVTGPINPDFELQTSYWETAWYNSTIKCLKITKVEVRYVDGSSNIYVNDLPSIIDKTMKNKCK